MSLNAAPRASERRRSSRSNFITMAAMAIAIASDRPVTIINSVSIVFAARSPLSQFELDRNFHNNVDRRAEASRRRKAPLPHRVDRPLVESGAEALEDLHVTDRAVAAD